MNNMSESNRIIVRDFFRGKGLNDFAVYGIKANIYAESRFESAIAQSYYMKKKGLTSEQYTDMVDSGEYTEFVTDRIGYGLCQWTYHSRKAELLERAKTKCVSIGDIYMQLEFMWDEFQNYHYMMDVLKNAKSVKEASDVVLMEYERPANAASKKDQRASYGQKMYDEDHRTLPYTIKNTNLYTYIYKDPLTNKTVGLFPVGTFTIVEEKIVKGIPFGKLKSGSGWIRLDVL